MPSKSAKNTPFLPLILDNLNIQPRFSHFFTAFLPKNKKHTKIVQKLTKGQNRSSLTAQGLLSKKGQNTS
jgi:hypothetical protein